MGFDLREVPELAIAGFAEDCVLQLVRHQGDQRQLERLFRQRLTGGEQRSELGHQLLSLWGDIGTEAHGFLAVGVDVVGFQYGGDRRRGPARVALAYAMGKLESVPTVLEDEALGALHGALGESGVPPVEILFPGPFEGEMARAAHGLAGAAAGIGVSLTPTDAETLRLVIVLAGEYGSDDEGAKALELFRKSYDDVAAADLGHLLGLHEPATAPVVAAAPLGLTLGVELDPEKLLRGLAAATVADIEEIMR
jgi:hypothetical protein